MEEKALYTPCDYCPYATTCNNMRGCATWQGWFKKTWRQVVNLFKD